MTKTSDSGFWSDGKVTDLKRLHLAGISHTQIAKEIGAASRCAVAGKLHRLGLSISKPRVKEISAEHNKGHVKASGPLPPRRIIKHLGKPLEGSNPKALMDLGSFQDDCRWPLDDGRFCCLPVARGAYCLRHGAVAYQATQPLKETYLQRTRKAA